MKPVVIWVVEPYNFSKNGFKMFFRKKHEIVNGKQLAIFV